VKRLTGDRLQASEAHNSMTRGVARRPAARAGMGRLYYSVIVTILTGTTHGGGQLPEAS
jgi:hypothetical protein